MGRSAASATATPVPIEWPGAVGHQAGESRGLPRNDLTVAVEIEDDRFVVLRNDMPGNQLLAVVGFKQNFLGLGQAGCGGRYARRIRMIEQRAFAKTEGGEQGAIGGRCNHEQPFQLRRDSMSIHDDDALSLCNRTGDPHLTAQSALTISSVIFLPSPNSIMVLSRKNSSFSTPA